MISAPRSGIFHGKAKIRRTLSAGLVLCLAGCAALPADQTAAFKKIASADQGSVASTNSC